MEIKPENIKQPLDLPANYCRKQKNNYLYIKLAYRIGLRYFDITLERNLKG